MGETPVNAFIKRWELSGAAEWANCRTFLAELCTLLDVPWPEPTTPDPARNADVFERAIPSPDGTSTNSIELYKRGCLVHDATRARVPLHPTIQPSRSKSGSSGPRFARALPSGAPEPVAGHPCLR